MLYLKIILVLLLNIMTMNQSVLVASWLPSLPNSITSFVDSAGEKVDKIRAEATQKVEVARAKLEEFQVAAAQEIEDRIDSSQSEPALESRITDLGKNQDPDMSANPENAPNPFTFFFNSARETAAELQVAAAVKLDVAEQSISALKESITSEISCLQKPPEQSNLKKNDINIDKKEDLSLINQDIVPEDPVIPDGLTNPQTSVDPDRLEIQHLILIDEDLDDELDEHQEQDSGPVPAKSENPDELENQLPSDLKDQNIILRDEDLDDELPDYEEQDQSPLPANPENLDLPKKNDSNLSSSIPFYLVGTTLALTIGYGLYEVYIDFEELKEDESLNQDSTKLSTSELVFAALSKTKKRILKKIFKESIPTKRAPAIKEETNIAIP